jgi:hypothetical protein
LICGVVLLIVAIQVFVGLGGGYVKVLIQRIKRWMHDVHASATVDGKEVKVTKEKE